MLLKGEQLAAHLERELRPLYVVYGDEPLLYIRGRDFVFGLARPGINVSIVSNARLKNSWYGRQDNADDMTDRLVKEGTHELCHCMGLDHCEDPECIMYCPQTLDELDRKKKTLCEKCSQELNIYRFSDLAD